MSDQKIAEFRERAEGGVTPPEPGLLLERGRALRRRRQLAPVVAVAATAAVAFGLFTIRGDVQSDPPPANQVTESPDSGPPLLDGDGLMEPQTYGMDRLGDSRVDLLVDLVGENWYAWPGGAWMTSPQGTVSWGLDTYAGTNIDRCRPDHRAKTRAGAITQLSQILGTVTQAARPASRLGMTGAHMQVRIPVNPECPSGVEPAEHNLMAIWDGGSTASTVTVDVWLLGDGKDLVILTRGVRGTPPAEMLENLDLTLDTLRLAPTP
jgi:hypothetical protein